MKQLTSIVALNEDGAIGCQNQLPWRLKTDLKFFRSQTLGNVVIMGRKTFESIGKPLPGRHNIVLSHNNVLFAQDENSEVATSIDEALAKAGKFKRSGIFVVGGASTYEQFAPFVDRYLFTRVCKIIPHADAFFDEGMIGDVNEWDLHLLPGIQPVPGLDEADFAVIEAIHRDGKRIKGVRDERIANWKQRAAQIGNRRAHSHIKRENTAALHL